MDTSIRSWVGWLQRYGAEPFAEALHRDVQGVLSRCVNCRRRIALDFFEGGGIGDWQTVTDGGEVEGDYGCERSPDTDAEGTGGHVPERASG